MKFHELTLNNQEKIKRLALAYFTIKGAPNPQENLERLMRGDRKKEGWRNKPYYLMLGIDAHRQRMGLSKIYS